MTMIGHNNPPAEAKKTVKQPNISKEQLQSILERIEKLEEEKAGIAADIKDIKLEAKGNGYDVATINTLLKLRRMEENEREERDYLLSTYMGALGMITYGDNDNFGDDEGVE